MPEIEALKLIGSTPMLHLKTLDPKPGVEIHAKLEFLNPTGSYKDRIIAYIIQKSIESGKITDNTTIVEGSSGNTGASVAMVASSMGLKSKIFVPDKCSDEKAAIIRSYGAEVTVIDAPESYEAAAAQKGKEDENYYHIDQYNNPLNPEAHYMTIGKEIWEDMNGEIDAFVATASTGGAISGIARRLKENDPGIRITLADPEGSIYKPYFEGKEDYMSYKKPFKVEGAGKAAIVDAMNFDILDDAISFNDENAIEMAHRLARQEGLMVGGSSGGNVWAALEIAKRMKGPAKIVTVLPDSGFKYMSKVFNPKWLDEIGLGHLVAK
ncbi:PLP-dependent cysteine synthase family protein [Salinivirga cyanobacteriivorans]